MSWTPGGKQEQFAHDHNRIDGNWTRHALLCSAWILLQAIVSMRSGFGFGFGEYDDDRRGYFRLAEPAFVLRLSTAGI